MEISIFQVLKNVSNGVHRHPYAVGPCVITYRADIEIQMRPKWGEAQSQALDVLSHPDEYCSGQVVKVGHEIFIIPCRWLIPVPNPSANYWIMVGAYADQVHDGPAVIRSVRQWDAQSDSWSPTQERFLNQADLEKSGIQITIRELLYPALYRQFALEEKADGTWAIHLADEEL